MRIKALSLGLSQFLVIGPYEMGFEILGRGGERSEVVKS